MAGKGIAETARLIASLELKDKLGPGIASASKQLGGLEGRLNRIGGIASKGMATAARNIATIGIAAAGAVAGLVARSVKEGQEAAKVQTIYAKAIKNSANMTKTLKDELAGAIAEQKAAKPDSALWNRLADNIDKVKQKMRVMGPGMAGYTAILDAQQAALMDLAGVDDELIKTEQTRLIQMGLNGDAVRTLTPLILDASKATGKDLMAVTLAVGKAVNGNVAGLQRYGIVIDKDAAKTDAFGAVVDALNKKFGGTTQALSGTLETRLGALREGLANIREEAGIKLLPALTHIVDVIGKSAVPAFGKLVDRIMPAVTGSIDELARALEGGGAEKAIGGISDAVGTMVGLLQAAAGPVKMIVGAFMSLPKELQTILVAGFAVNKISGGMLVQLGGELFKRGGTPANPLFVAPVGPGSLGGGVAGGVAGGKGIAGAISKVFMVGIAAGVAFELAQVLGEQSADIKMQGADLLAATKANSPKMNAQEIRNALANIDEQLRDPLKMFALTMTQPFNDGLKNLLTVQGELNAELARIEGGKRPAGGAVSSPLGPDAQERVKLMAGAPDVYARAVANGLKPPASAVTKTLERNEQRYREMASAARAAADRTIIALAGIERTVASKDWSPRITVPVSVSVPISVRDVTRSQTIRRTYTGGRTIVGGRVVL